MLAAYDSIDDWYDESIRTRVSLGAAPDAGAYLKAFEETGPFFQKAIEPNFRTGTFRRSPFFSVAGRGRILAR